MSASKLVTIMCDAKGCGVWWDRGVAENAQKARAGLEGTGWELNVPHSTWRMRLDYCPIHARERKARNG